MMIMTIMITKGIILKAITITTEEDMRPTITMEGCKTRTEEMMKLCLVDRNSMIDIAFTIKEAMIGTMILIQANMATMMAT